MSTPNPLIALAVTMTARAKQENPEATDHARQGAEAALWRAATHPGAVEWLTAEMEAEE